MKKRAIFEVVMVTMFLEILGSITAAAQQTPGSPASPSATTTVDKRRLPNPPGASGAVINPNGLKSTPFWQNQVMAELRLSGSSKAERNSGVWIDGKYVGCLKELKGNKKIMLLPGAYEISVRQAGYEDFTRKIVAEPGQVQPFPVKMEREPRAEYPGANAAILKLNITPERAAVFVDGGYIGPASDFGGAFHSMLIIPGKHRITIELPGYQSFETEINLLTRQKSEVKTELVRGSIEQAGALIKQP